MKKSAVKSAKCSIVAARKASLQRKRRLGIDLSEAGLGPEHIRALVLESVENLRGTHEARRRQRTSPNVVLTVSYATTGGPFRLSRGRTTNLPATNHFQNAENLLGTSRSSRLGGTLKGTCTNISISTFTSFVRRGEGLEILQGTRTRSLKAACRRGLREERCGCTAPEKGL
ncbi:hypothetical protein DFP72DRAFT_898378, partial [Ephemerocybe angulata]